jgi:tRNA(Ile)-lysidine synthase TilS/MesJ
LVGWLLVVGKREWKIKVLVISIETGVVAESFTLNKFAKEMSERCEKLRFSPAVQRKRFSQG